MSRGWTRARTGAKGYTPLVYVTQLLHSFTSGGVSLADAERSVGRFKDKVRQLTRQGRGRNLERFIEQDLNPLMRGWANYYRKATTYGVFEDLDGWLRRKLRCLIWPRWKRRYTCARRLIALGFTEAKAWRSACNGRGPWWNAGSSHMNAAYPAATFQGMGLVSLLATVKVSESPTHRAPACPA